MRTAFYMEGKLIFSWKHDVAIPVVGNVILVNRTKYLVTGIIFNYDNNEIEIMVI